MILGMADGIYGAYTYPSGGYGWSSDPCTDISIQSAFLSGAYTTAQLQALAAGQTITVNGLATNAHLDQICAPGTQHDQIVSSGPPPPSWYAAAANAGPLIQPVITQPAPQNTSTATPTWAGTAPGASVSAPGAVVIPASTTTAAPTTGTAVTSPAAAPSWLPSFLASPLGSVSTSTGLSDTTLLLIAAGIVGVVIYMGSRK